MREVFLLRSPVTCQRPAPSSVQQGHSTLVYDGQRGLGISEPHYPFHDNTVLVTRCGRLCLHRKKINLSKSSAAQAVGIKEVEDGIWLVSFMQYDLGYVDLEERTLQRLDNTFGPKVLPMCPDWTSS